MLNAKLAEAHLAEARRLGVPAWTLEELEAALNQCADHGEILDIPAFLTHLKSLPNA